MWSILTKEYYSARRRNELLRHASTWINLENTMQSERRQAYKTMYYMTPFT
jgi:hypothetical protein